MKNKNTVYIVSVVVIVIIIILVISLTRGSSNSESASNQVASSTVTVPTTETVTTQNTKTPTPVIIPTAPSQTKSPVIPSAINTQLSYEQYMKQLSANQQKCDDAAVTQYKQLYVANMESSSSHSYYNTVNGMCFLKVSGKIHAAYTASTTGAIYFRNVTKNTLLADCADKVGLTFADSEYSCTNRVSGAAMSMGQFNDYISATVSK